MMHLGFSHNEIPKSNVQPIAYSIDGGGAGRECGRGEYKLQSSTKAGLVLQLSEGSEREENEQSVGYRRRLILVEQDEMSRTVRMNHLSSGKWLLVSCIRIVESWMRTVHSNVR
jgi:hypothetical protein